MLDLGCQWVVADSWVVLLACQRRFRFEKRCLSTRDWREVVKAMGSLLRAALKTTGLFASLRWLVLIQLGEDNSHEGFNPGGIGHGCDYDFYRHTVRRLESVADALLFKVVTEKDEIIIGLNAQELQAYRRVGEECRRRRPGAGGQEDIDGLAVFGAQIGQR